MATPICVIDETGIHRPTLATVLAWVVDQFTAIYGPVSLDSSTIDGEWVGLLASAIDDTNASCVQAYNAFPPGTAQGTGLSSVVKINGLTRLVPSYSTALMLIVGQAGTSIAAGIVVDEAGFSWALPAVVVIPYSGQIAVTATCMTLGAISAPAGTINAIANNQPGWQTASNTAKATPGAPLETDAILRARQSVSTMNSSTAILQGIVGAVAALPGVSRVRGYENEGDLPDENGIPGHCIAIVVDGGDATAIASAIKAKKGGCATYGTTKVILTDVYGVPSSVAFFQVSGPVVTAAIGINQLATFTSDVITQIKQSVSDWINARGIGNSVQWTRLYGPAYLYGLGASNTFEVITLAAARDGNTPIQQDVAIAFYEGAYTTPDDITVTVLN